MNRQADDELTQRIKAHYEKQSLPLATLQELQSLPFPSTPKRRLFIIPSSGMVEHLRRITVVCLFLLLGAFIGQYYVEQNGEMQPPIDLMAAEIALNHQKRFELDFQASDVSMLDKSMAALDFTLVHPQRLSDEYAVLGARYCTIQSVIAAQVRLEDEAQRSYTLYQFRSPGEEMQLLQGETAVVVNDVEVTFWQEGELLMGLAHGVDGDTFD